MFGHVWNNIILLNLNEFENIGIDFYINVFFFFLSVAIIVIALVFEYSRGTVHITVKQLVRHEARGADNAKSLKELGLNRNRIVMLLLSRSRDLNSVVKRLGKPEIDYEGYMKLSREEKKKIFSIDFENEKFYLSEENKERVDRILSRYAFSLPRFIAFSVLVILLWGAVAAFSYEILAYLNSIIITK